VCSSAIRDKKKRKERCIMRKIVLLFFVALFMTVPAMAVPSTVSINCTVDNDNKTVTVSYTSDPCRIRAFGLDITVDTNRITRVDVCDANYRIYPGQISIVDGDVNSYKTPYDPCDLGDANVAVEMGSLYTTDPCYATDVNAGYNKIPGLSGTLLKFYVGGDCNYTLDVNVARGGIVMEDPYEAPSFTRPLCIGHIGGGMLYYDFGDAPDNAYKTLLLSNGPRHSMTGPTTGTGPILGLLIDAEGDGVPTVNCTGDDAAGLADEDGIKFGKLIINETGTVTVKVTNGPGKLDAWIDWGNDSSFAQPIDKLVFNEGSTVNTGDNVRTFTVPGESAGIAEETTLYSRWRISTAGTPDYYGPASSGEVEDYHNPADPCQRLQWHVPNVVGDLNTVGLAKLLQNGLKVTIVSEVNCVNDVDTVLRTVPPYCTYPDNNMVNMVVAVRPPTPGAATIPTPAHGATCVTLTTDLSWTPGANTATQDVYWGTTNPPPIKASGVPVGTTTYDTGTMPIYTCYYWQIDELNACGVKTTGTVWRFRTGPTNSLWPCCATCLGDVTNDGWVKSTDVSALDLLLRTAPLNRYQYTSPKYNACGDYNQDGWNKSTDVSAIDLLLRPLPLNRLKCPTCP
jgi:hypothetical protein